MMVEANVRIKTGGGPDANQYSHTPGTPLIRTEIALDEIQIEFKTQFCSLHPMQHIDHQSKCSKCDERASILIHEHIASGMTKTDCKHVLHTHECGCHLGHECKEGCSIFDAHAKRIEAMSEGEVEKERLKKALYGMAKEAPTETMLSVYDRLELLENENKDLRLVVSKLLAHLPGDVCEAVGGTQNL